MSRTPRFVLASSSPRRHQLLRDAGFEFEIRESGVDEVSLPQEAGADFALRMAREKALAVSSRERDAIVLGADTVVIIDGDLLGKPSTPEHARMMLERLSSRT